MVVLNKLNAVQILLMLMLIKIKVRLHVIIKIYYVRNEINVGILEYPL